VIVITIGLFFVSSFLLPYAPTILASTLVFFLGLELMTEALWESTKSMIWCEWFVVFGTFLACTFWGFAPGFGVGLALAAIMHIMLTAFDSVSKLTISKYRKLPEGPDVRLQKVRMFKLSQREALHHYQRCSGDPRSFLAPEADGASDQALITDIVLLKPDETRHDSGNSITIVGKEASQQTTLEENHSDVTVIRLSGYVCMWSHIL
jgi:MFS superfamily sulfate permease-like transporter